MCPQLKADNDSQALQTTDLQQQLHAAQARAEDAEGTIANMTTAHQAQMATLDRKTSAMSSIIEQVSRVDTLSCHMHKL